MAKRICDDLIPGRDVVDLIFKQPRFKKIISIRDMARFFNDSLDEKYRQHVKLVDLKDSVLYVEADNPLWSMEFGFQKEKIVMQIRKRYGVGSFKDLVVRTKMSGSDRKKEKKKELA